MQSLSLRRRNGATARPDTSLPLKLVGFSKGAVVLNQLVTELAWEATPAALSPRTPTRSKRNDPCDDGGPAQMMNNRKRSRVSLNDCGGGGRPISSEGILTNPPSPAASWEGEGGREERDGVDACNERSQGPKDGTGRGSGGRSRQVRLRMQKGFDSRQPHWPRWGIDKVGWCGSIVVRVFASVRFLESSRRSKGLWRLCPVIWDGCALAGKYHLQTQRWCYCTPQ